MSEIIDVRYFSRAPDLVARDLIGMTLVGVRDGECGGRIVECEAYGDASDLASHTAVYPKARAPLLAAEPGTLYVYRSYGIHLCLNIVAHEPGGAGAILIRAIEPTIGLDLLRARRPGVPDRRLMSGPGTVTIGLAIRQEDTGRVLFDENPICLSVGSSVADVVATPRIGITRDVDRRWRFVDADSRFLSGPRALSRASI